MTHEDAATIKLDIFQSVGESIHIDPDTSLWYMAYLYDQGYDFGEIERLQGEINSLMKRQLAEAARPADCPAPSRAELERPAAE